MHVQSIKFPNTTNLSDFIHLLANFESKSTVVQFGVADFLLFNIL